MVKSTVSASIEVADIVKMEAICKDRDIGVSEYIREAVLEKMDREKSEWGSEQ